MQAPGAVADGIENAGANWTSSDPGGSCTAKCADMGKTYDLTLDYAGNSGSEANCKTVPDALMPGLALYQPPFQHAGYRLCRAAACSGHARGAMGLLTANDGRRCVCFHRAVLRM